MSDEDAIQPAESTLNDDPNYYMKQYTYNDIIQDSIIEDIKSRSKEPSDEDKLRIQENMTIKYNYYLYLLHFYESKSNEMYNFIKKESPEKIIYTNNKKPSETLLKIFDQKSKYNINKIILKSIQNIPCETNDQYIKSYIKTVKRDWNRAIFYSNKNNNFYRIKSDLPYIQTDDSKTFLIIATAIVNYLMSDKNMGFNITIRERQINNKDPMTNEDINNTSCKCTVPEYLAICDPFDKLPIKNYAVKKILYDLSFIHQGTNGAEELGMLNKLFFKYKYEYDNIEKFFSNKITFNQGFVKYGDSVKYFDYKQNTMVFIMTIGLNCMTADGDVIVIPIYQLIKLFPFNITEFNYSFLYLTDDSVSRKNTDFFRFVVDSVGYYLNKYEENPNFFRQIQSPVYYVEPDYLQYINEIAEQFKNTHPSSENDPQPLSKDQIDRYNLYTLGGKRRKSKLKRKTRRVRNSRHSKRSNKNRNGKTRVKK